MAGVAVRHATHVSAGAAANSVNFADTRCSITGALMTGHVLVMNGAPHVIVHFIDDSSHTPEALPARYRNATPLDIHVRLPTYEGGES